MEAFGLVGFFAVLQPLLTILDMGLSPSVNRELARYSVLPGHEGKMRDLVRTLETIYWGMAVVICIFVLIATPTISTSWVKVNTLPPSQIRQAVLLMGLSLVVQWPVGFYSGGLMGLQRQVLLNAVNSMIWTIRGVGAVLVVAVSSNKVVDFFGWQLAMGFLNVIALSLLLWRAMPPSFRPARFDRGILQSVWRLALGMSAVSVAILLFNQMDKIILSRQIQLTQFGYYSLAWQVVSCLFLFYYPVYCAFFPPMTQAFSKGDRIGMVEIYHKGCQFMSVAVLPVTAIIALFSKDILLLWTHNPETAEQCHKVLSMLMVGATCNGLLYMPYAARQAAGSMRRILYIFVPFLFVYTALLLMVIPGFGVEGAAMVFSVVSFLQVGVAIYWTHRDILPGEHIKWCIDDFGKPLVASVGMAMTGKLIAGDEMNGVEGIIKLLLVSMATVFSAAYITPMTRMFLKDYGGRLIGGCRTE